MKHKFWLNREFWGWGLWMWAIGFTLLAGSWGAESAVAATSKEIDVSVDVRLADFERDVDGAKKFLANAKGLLVFPTVIKAGVGFGGEYGEGALRINGKTVAYYSTMAASFGLQFGAQAKTILLVFLDEDALNRFRKSEGWKVGVDGSVAVVVIGAGTSLDSSKLNQPIVGFVLDQKGLMYNLTLEGAKFTKINK
jgi:lipid-binding SYLF domain-containing protein